MKAIINFLKRTKIRVSIAIVCFFLIGFTFTFGPYYQLLYNEGGSMENTIQDGSWLIMEKRRSLGSTWSPAKHDIVAVYAGNGDLLIKRVLGIPGDTIAIEGGYIIINGELQANRNYGSGRVQFVLIDASDDTPIGTNYVDNLPQVIPEDFIWVIGDNRNDSMYGLYPFKWVKGKIIFW